MSENLKYKVLAALGNAANENDYRRAKLLVARLPRMDQLAVVDSIRDARARLVREGVL